MPKDFTETVADNVRAEAARRRVSQAEIAKLLGVTPATISYRFNNQSPWPLNDLAALAQTWGVPVSTFVGERAA